MREQHVQSPCGGKGSWLLGGLKDTQADWCTKGKGGVGG